MGPIYIRSGQLLSDPMIPVISDAPIQVFGVITSKTHIIEAVSKF